MPSYLITKINPIKQLNLNKKRNLNQMKYYNNIIEMAMLMVKLNKVINTEALILANESFNQDIR